MTFPKNELAAAFPRYAKTGRWAFPDGSRELSGWRALASELDEAVAALPKSVLNVTFSADRGFGGEGWEREEDFRQVLETDRHGSFQPLKDIRGARKDL